MSLARSAKFLLAVSFASCLLLGCSHGPGYIAGHCERRVEATTDPVALQAWATDLLDRYSLAKTNYGGPFSVYPPLNSVWDQAPPSVAILGGDGQGDEFVCVIWGAAPGHWGLSI